MNNLNDDAVKHLAMLARIKFSNDELEAMGNELDQILGYVKELQELDTDSVDPTSHGVQLVAKFRQDQRGEGVSREVALDQAPEHLGEGFGVPKVIDA